MNIIFMRHGEATDNVKELISDKEIYWSVLTENGKKTVLESVNALPKNIDKIYVSPFPRTVETAHFVFEKYPNIEVIIEKRLHEIYYGKYSGQKNNEELNWNATNINDHLRHIDSRLDKHFEYPYYYIDNLQKDYIMECMKARED